MTGIMLSASRCQYKVTGHCSIGCSGGIITLLPVNCCDSVSGCLSGHGPVMAIFELLDYIVNEVRVFTCLRFRLKA